jgi:tetraacyldisaccharide 4'-kinase
MTRGPVPSAVGVLGEPLYRAALAWRSRRFDRGSGVIRLDRPVISVGNLSVGGTGKTPLVRRIVAHLLDRGFRPAIAMRGYKATPQRESDEAEAHRRALPGVPVVAQADRVAGLIALFATDAGARVDCVVLDDGFQHRRLARDLDVVLLDASRDPFADRLLPRGWLREPVAALARAHAVVVTHAELAPPAVVGGIVERARGVRPDLTAAVSRHRWAAVEVRDEAGQGFSVRPTETLRGRRVLPVCAIGNPEGFLAAARDAAGGRTLAPIVLPDHDPYRETTVQRVIDAARAGGAEAIVTTDKDWAKLSAVPGERWPCALARAVLEIAFDSGEAALLALAEHAARVGGDRAPDGA